MQDYFFVQWKQFLINLKTKHFEQKIQMKFKYLNQRSIQQYLLCRQNQHKMHKNFILNDEKNINNEIFKEYFWYHNP